MTRTIRKYFIRASDIARRKICFPFKGLIIRRKVRCRCVKQLLKAIDDKVAFLKIIDPIFGAHNAH